MITQIVTWAAALLVAFLIFYFAYPKQLFGLLLRTMRWTCGLKLRSIDVDGNSWPFLEGGPESGEVLLLLHGFGGDKDNWPIYARNFKKRYRIIIPDLPGFGDSPRTPGEDYRIAAQTERLIRFINALGIDRLHIAGNSMGGYLALKFALTYPENVSTLALFNNAGVLTDRKSELELAVERGDNPLTVMSIEEFESLIAFIFYRPIPAPGIIKRVLGAEAVARHDFLDAIFWSLTEEIRSQPLNDQLHLVKAPTLIIWGRHDRVMDVSCTEVMSAKIPTNRCVIFEATGHVPMLERPVEASAVHLDFLRQYGAA